jgi:hypothetical protein
VLADNWKRFGKQRGEPNMKKQRMTFAEAVEAEFARCEALAEALAKLQEVQGRQAALLAELAEVEAEAGTDVAELASKVLAGESLEDRTSLFAKREALKQQAAAFEEALRQQRAKVANERSHAAAAVAEALEPAYRASLARFEKAVAGLEEAASELMSIGQEAVRGGLVGWPIPNNRHIQDSLAAIRFALEAVTSKPRQRMAAEEPAEKGDGLILARVPATTD